MAKFEDQKLTCEECGTEFVWDASEQAYFAKKGFKKVPKRCRACRAKKQIELQKEKEKEKEITCAKCGKKSITSNEIAPEEETLCLDCYLKESQN
jgi:hypothetical protein